MAVTYPTFPEDMCVCPSQSCTIQKKGMVGPWACPRHAALCGSYFVVKAHCYSLYAYTERKSYAYLFLLLPSFLASPLSLHHLLSMPSHASFSSLPTSVSFMCFCVLKQQQHDISCEQTSLPASLTITYILVHLPCAAFCSFCTFAHTCTARALAFL